MGGKLYAAIEERDDARELVDGLLAVNPLTKIDSDYYRGDKRQCWVCSWTSYDGEEEHDDDCAYQRAEKARDWEPVIHD